MQNLDNKILTTMSYMGEIDYHISGENGEKCTYIDTKEYEKICDKYNLHKISYNNFQGLSRTEYRILNK